MFHMTFQTQLYYLTVHSIRLSKSWIAIVIACTNLPPWSHYLYVVSRFSITPLKEWTSSIATFLPRWIRNMLQCCQTVSSFTRQNHITVKLQSIYTLYNFILGTLNQWTPKLQTQLGETFNVDTLKCEHLFISQVPDVLLKVFQNPSSQ